MKNCTRKFNFVMFKKKRKFRNIFEDLTKKTIINLFIRNFCNLETKNRSWNFGDIPLKQKYIQYMVY